MPVPARLCLTTDLVTRPVRGDPLIRPIPVIDGVTAALHPQPPTAQCPAPASMGGERRLTGTPLCPPSEKLVPAKQFTRAYSAASRRLLTGTNTCSDGDTLGIHAVGQARFWLTGVPEVVSAVMSSVWNNGILKGASGAERRRYPAWIWRAQAQTFKPEPPQPAIERNR